MCCFFFFFNDTATTEIYTLSLHDALPIFTELAPGRHRSPQEAPRAPGLKMKKGQDSKPWPFQRCSGWRSLRPQDRKSTRLNSSHANISYAVFCLKKKK